MQTLEALSVEYCKWINGNGTHCHMIHCLFVVRSQKQQQQLFVQPPAPLRRHAYSRPECGCHCALGSMRFRMFHLISLTSPVRQAGSQAAAAAAAAEGTLASCSRTKLADTLFAWGAALPLPGLVCERVKQWDTRQLTETLNCSHFGWQQCLGERRAWSGTECKQPFGGEGSARAVIQQHIWSRSAVVFKALWRLLRTLYTHARVRRCLSNNNNGPRNGIACTPLHPSLFHRAVSCGVCLGSHTALFRAGDAKQEQMSVGLKKLNETPQPWPFDPLRQLSSTQFPPPNPCVTTTQDKTTQLTHSPHKE